MAEASNMDLHCMVWVDAANKMDVLEDIFLQTIQSINALKYHLNSLNVIGEFKSRILHEAINCNPQLSWPNATPELMESYRKAVEDATDLKEQIPETKAALVEAPLIEGTYLMQEIEKYRIRFVPKA